MPTLIWSELTTVAVVFAPVPAMAAVELKPPGFVSVTKYVPGLMKAGATVAVEKLHVPVAPVVIVVPTWTSGPVSVPDASVSRNSLTCAFARPPSPPF
jgi:hypothetical protein